MVSKKPLCLTILASLATKDDVDTLATTSRDDLLAELWTLTRRYGPRGAFAPPEDQDRIQALADALQAHSLVAAPAREPLQGTFELVYCNSSMQSSGRLFGPVYGHVTQEFFDSEMLENRVSIMGFITIALTVKCSVVNDFLNRVDFKKFKVVLAGRTVLEKETSNGGTWDYRFMGEVVEPGTGKTKLLRVMNTPNLFILCQDVETRRP
jgi:hypothetical protein